MGTEARGVVTEKGDCDSLVSTDGFDKSSF